jgi:hypothetical protein
MLDVGNVPPTGNLERDVGGRRPIAVTRNSGPFFRIADVRVPNKSGMGHLVLGQAARA